MCVVHTGEGLSSKCVRTDLSSNTHFHLQMQQCKGQMGSPSLFYSPIILGGLYVFLAPPHHSVCVWELELISRSNSNDIPPLQIKLFSSSIHLFSPSFVLHPAADSVSPWQKTCARQSPDPRIAKSQLVCFCWGLCGTTVSPCDQRDLGSSTRDENKTSFCFSSKKCISFLTFYIVLEQYF